jgi:flagellar hook-length control protein FliK
VGHTVAASSTTATGSSQNVRAAENAQRSRSAREGGATSAFAEALDEQQRALGEAEQDSRIARARQQRRPAGQPDPISATADSAVPRRLSDDKPVADDDAMAEATAGSEKPVAPVEAAATEEAKPTEAPATEGEQSAAAEPERPPVPVPAVQQVAASVEAQPAAPADAEVAAPPVAAVAPPPRTELPAEGQAAPPVAETAAAAQPAVAKPTPPPTAAPEQAASAPQGQPDAKAAAKAEPRAEVRAEVRVEARAETPAPQPQAAAPAAAEASPAPAQPAATPAPAGPLSFAHEVAQKVAAQTQAAGSVVPVHALAVTIAARASTGSTRFDIKLDPPELGRIEVQMTLDREGRVKSRVVVEKQETLDLLQRDQRNLERTLTQAGLETSEGGIEFSLRDQGGDGRQGEGDRPVRTWQATVEDPDATATLAANAATYSRLAAARGGIDIRI